MEKLTLADIQTHFKNLIATDHLSHAYLFAEPVNAGALALAQWLAERLFCSQLTEDGAPCGHCAECLRIQNGNNPDYLVVQTATQSIGVDDVRFLKQELSKSGLSNRRVFVIADADKMTLPAANSLLKFLEEPVSQVLIILTTTRLAQILPTIRSRVQTVLLPEPVLAERAAQIATLGVTPELGHLLSQMPLTLATIKELQEQDLFQETLSAFWQWYENLAQGQPLAFAQVQSTILPRFKAKPMHQFLEELLIMAFSDLFTTKFQLTTALRWPQQKERQQELAAKLSASQVTRFLSQALGVKQQLDANVSFQNTLEQLSLQLILIKEGNFK
ncbi:DNA polymerase III subunit delta' [Lapidilactobacillus achengensis]|uniref:DNA polymerase III subunit delta n=1 Tax=Lapidilactobacillus achengensis TaxID=2486000 RepID=A0ABW1ULX5_9LACO|nr:DNA polymerase III subunit delta' [Lapidilactobacillus achengensis]